MSKSYAIWVEGYGFVTQDAARFVFTEEPDEALHYARPVAEAIITALRADTAGTVQCGGRMGLVEWIHD